jgi:DNA-binding LacI/PurR family transcriptional regulator
VAPGRAEIARVAVDLLMDKLSGAPARPGGAEIVVGHQLVVRESTGQGR